MSSGLGTMLPTDVCTETRIVHRRRNQVTYTRTDGHKYLIICARSYTVKCLTMLVLRFSTENKMQEEMKNCFEDLNTGREMW
jgi:hypothetical protein